MGTSYVSYTRVYVFTWLAIIKMKMQAKILIPQTGKIYLVKLRSGMVHSVPSYKERSYKERLVEMPKSKEQWLVEFGALKEHLS